VDAAPIAFIVTLLCAHEFVPFVVPGSLLQVWLWLRHPRARSRYLIAIATILLLFLNQWGDEIWEYCLLCMTSEYPRLLLDSYEIYPPVSALAAAGVVPILYRIVSRNSFSFSGDEHALNQRQSRGGITDILFLSLFAALIFLFVRDEWDRRFAFRYVEVPMLFSLGAIVSMRLLAHGQRVALVLRFLLAWLISVIPVVCASEIHRFFYYRSRPKFSFLGYRLSNKEFVWFEDIGDAIPAMSVVFLLPVFALVLRGCDIALTPIRRSDQAANGSEEANDTADRS
jgi:hypothetical protein